MRFIPGPSVGPNASRTLSSYPAAFAPESQRPAPKKSVYRSRSFHGSERGGLPAQRR